MSGILRELGDAFCLLKQRRAALEGQLPPKAKSVAWMLSRPMTTEEMALLVESSVEAVLAELRTRSSEVVSASSPDMDIPFWWLAFSLLPVEDKHVLFTDTIRKRMRAESRGLRTNRGIFH